MFVDIPRMIASGRTPEDVAAEIGLDVSHDHDGAYGPAVVLPDWWADVGGRPLEYPWAGSGVQAANEYVDDGVASGDFGPVATTTWVKVRVWRVGYAADGEVCRVNEEEVTVPINQDGSSCVDGEERHSVRVRAR